ncbi:hypothetical protein SALBM217S_01786 [Streptomyces griseoloalbus]
MPRPSRMSPGIPRPTLLPALLVLLLSAALALTTLTVPAPAAAPGGAWTVREPGAPRDGVTAVVRLDPADGTLTLTARKGAVTVLEPAPLGIVTSAADLTSGLRAECRHTRQVTERYSMTTGKQLRRTARMTETRFTFTGRDSARLGGGGPGRGRRRRLPLRPARLRHGHRRAGGVRVPAARRRAGLAHAVLGQLRAPVRPGHGARGARSPAAPPPSPAGSPWERPGRPPTSVSRSTSPTDGPSTATPARPPNSPRAGPCRATGPCGCRGVRPGGYDLTVRAEYRAPDRPGAGVLEVERPVRVFVPEPGVTYVSDLPFTSASNGWGPVERDGSNGETDPGDGGPLALAGTVRQGPRDARGR